MKCGEVKRREKVFMEKQSFPEKQTWATCEGLLLACAVHRFGWDSFKFVGFQRRFHKQLSQQWPKTQRIDPRLQISVVTATEQKISVKYRKYQPDLIVNKNIVRRYRRPIWIHHRTKRALSSSKHFIKHVIYISNSQTKTENKDKSTNEQKKSNEEEELRERQTWTVLARLEENMRDIPNLSIHINLCPPPPSSITTEHSKCQNPLKKVSYRWMIQRPPQYCVLIANRRSGIELGSFRERNRCTRNATQERER